jgi:ribosomal protein S18 acetylase RimI-like enzyme
VAVIPYVGSVTYVVREAVASDAEALGAVHVRAWQQGYRGGLMPDEFLEALSAEERAGLWRRALESGLRPRHRRFVAAEASGSAIGFIVVGPADGDPEAVVGEVFSLNVDPDHWGRGAGALLLEAGTAALAEVGFGSAVLWVHRDNARARRFYEARGWATDGAARDAEVIDVTVPEVRYARSLV